jgi:hypothetical protein
VDAADGNGNRSPRTTITAPTQSCPLAARLAGVGIARQGGARQLVLKLRVNRPTSALVALARLRTVVAHGRYGVKPGTNVLRLAIPRRVTGGSYRLKVTLVNPDGGLVVLPGRAILLPRPK